MITRTDRSEILASFGASPSQSEELLRYGTAGFQAPARIHATEVPLPDEPFVPVWAEYLAESVERGVLETLRNRLVQLRFPIRAGISSSPEYLSATRRGVVVERDTTGGLDLRAKDALRLEIHSTPAGRIPVLTTTERDDFVSLLRALTRRNEPDPIPDSMGACLVSGYNNWDRVSRLRAAWRDRNPFLAESRWSDEFRRLVPNKELYQDRFVLLSSGPYSGVSATELGIDGLDSDHFALTMRREHEFAHLFIRRVWGRMHAHVLEEIIADFVAILATTGRFHADWMLRFYGLEDPANPRPGGRLQNYLAGSPLTDGSVLILYRLVHAAAAHLEAFAAQIAGPLTGSAWTVNVLTLLPRLSLEALAAHEPARWSALHRNNP